MASSEDSTDDEPQEDDQDNKESQPETKAALTQQEWAKRSKTVEPVVEQEDDQLHIVELKLTRICHNGRRNCCKRKN